MAITPSPRAVKRSITGKLFFIALVFAAVVTALVAIVSQALYVTSGVRAYVEGEGLWSKGQKDGVHFLERYVRTGNEEDYNNFLGAIAIPLGDRDARLELERGGGDRQRIDDGFTRGGIAHEDIAALSQLFIWFHDVWFFRDAVQIWREAERDILSLVNVGLQVHEEHLRGSLTPAREQVLLDQIEQLNHHVTPLEEQFSQTLGHGARLTQHLLLAAIIAAAVVLFTVGGIVAWNIARSLREAVMVLRAGAMRVAAGDLKHRIRVRVEDELGELANVFNDMIEHRRIAEDELRDATEFRNKVMDNATNAIYVVDLRGVFTLANRRACEILGYPSEELLGSTYPRLVAPADQAAIFKLFSSLVTEGKSVSDFEVQLVRKDGTPRTLSVSAAPLIKDGRIFAAVAAADDITERKRAQIELANRAEELARSNRELEQFAYVASHDLQEPLRTVSGFAQLLSRHYVGKLGADADEYLDYISSGAERMKGLIDDLLAYSRVSREHLKLEPVLMGSVLSETLADMRATLQGASAVVSSDPLPSVRVDRAHARQLLQNLIANAVKFRRPGESPRVHVSSRRNGDKWEFSVRDNGIGIDPEHAERVFQLFQRLHTRDRYPGNGIGLTICKKIVDLNGGRIWVEPADPGSIFYFTLPAP